MGAPEPAHDAPAAAPPAAATARENHHAGESIKATLVSLLIAFILVLVFRAYVLEAFVIPTGSMAPTLLGRHARFQSDASGFSWAVNSWSERGRTGERRLQAADPLSAAPVDAPAIDSRPGDRILVLKSVYSVIEPRRWDVIVFKNPQKPDENYIKRLVGLPGERVWLVDGDVFTAPPGGSWAIARTPEPVQRGMWWSLFSSEASPPNGASEGEPWSGPWILERPGVTPAPVSTRDVTLSVRAGQEAALRWDHARWPITDVAAYNLGPMVRSPLTTGSDFAELFRRQLAGGFPSADLRLTAAVTVRDDRAALRATLLVNNHEFCAEIAGSGARLLMRPARREGVPPEPWRTLAEGAVTPLTIASAHAPAPIEFAHHDQSLTLSIGGAPVLSAEYEWGPFERLAHATGITVEEAAALENSGDVRPVLDASRYSPSRAQWSVGMHADGQGAAEAVVTLRRVGLARGLFYRPAFAEDVVGQPARGTHPSRIVTLSNTEFFALGDNSASSKDGRLWESVNPWIATLIDPSPGVVPRDLLIGRAVFVYFPAPQDVEVAGRRRSVVPDFGRMRWIR